MKIDISYAVWNHKHWIYLLDRYDASVESFTAAEARAMARAFLNAADDLDAMECESRKSHNHRVEDGEVTIWTIADQVRKEAALR